MTRYYNSHMDTVMCMDCHEKLEKIFGTKAMNNLGFVFSPDAPNANVDFKDPCVTCDKDAVVKVHDPGLD